MIAKQSGPLRSAGSRMFEAGARATRMAAPPSADVVASRPHRRRLSGAIGSALWGAVAFALGIRPIDTRVDGSVASATAIGPVVIALSAGGALVLAAFAANASRLGESWAAPAFYIAIALLFLPAVTRIAQREVSRSERIAILLTVTLSLFVLRVIRSPLFFFAHDEYLHWTTAQDLVEHGRLFSPSVLFPVAPSFPGLEIVVTAISQLSGLSIFTSALLGLAVARLLFVGSLFLIYERVTGSARVAALACLFYMGSSTFVFFDTIFAYESMALPLFAFALLLEQKITEPGVAFSRPLFGALLLTLLALAMTHHVTAYALAAFLVGLVGVDLLRGGPRAVRWPQGLAAICAVLVTLAWSNAMGNPGNGYLGPVFEDAWHGLVQVFQFGSGRKLFTGDDGTVAPLWQRVITLSSVGLTCLGLSLGFFRALSWAGAPFARGCVKGWSSVVGWSNSLLVLLTCLTLLYPVSILFRLTRSGWEVGNRIGPFAFLGVGVVLAIAAIASTPNKGRGLFHATVIGILATVMLVGGVISSEGPRILVPERYQVSADGASIEPMGIDAALWTRQWLGPGNHFVADRVNRLLLSGFGRQLVSNTLQHHDDAGEVLIADELGPAEQYLLKKLEIDYLFADLRLTTGLPVVGSYFDGALADQMLSTPPQPSAMLKFNSNQAVSRVFDDGYDVIFDVRGLSGRR